MRTRWRRSEQLTNLPASISLLPLASRSAELKPVRNLWQYMHDNSFSNRVFSYYKNILDHSAGAWNRLTDQPWTIMSIGLRDWGYRL